VTSVALGVRDLRGVLAFVSDAHDVDAPDPLTTELLDRLAELVGCEYATYESLDWRRQAQIGYVACSNEDPVADSLHDDFWELADDPGFKAKPPLCKLSDRHDRRQRERIRDEEAVNTEFSVVDRLWISVGDSTKRTASVGFDSQTRDFDERDRDLALGLRPHLEVLWRRSVSRRKTAELLAALERDGDDAIVLFDADGRIDHATAEAQRLLAMWFRTPNGRLPPELEEWVSFAHPGDKYTERRNGSILTVEAAGDFTLSFREHASADVGLTPREREVLTLVDDGLTNAQIARRLWVADSTVAKHLEQAYAKLGVHSRTAAVARLRKLPE
jgi:DNA-binding NarL/FixJ family response regulator